MMSQKLDLWNYVIGWHIQKEKMKKVHLPEISLLVQIGEEVQAGLSFDNSM